MQARCIEIKRATVAKTSLNVGLLKSIAWSDFSRLVLLDLLEGHYGGQRAKND
jgi:hypothetical protein